MGDRPSREHEPKKMGDARPKYHHSSSSRPVRQLGQLHDSLHEQSNSRESIERLSPPWRFCVEAQIHWSGPC
ncbi:hypothetical protein ACFX13_010227 [Malus domestica]